MNTVLSVRNLTKSFKKRTVVNKVSFDVFEGEVFGFLGPNGAGKTTTIKMIMGFLFPDEGEISVCGMSLRQNYEQAMAQMGGIVESPEMYRELTGYENLKMYAALHPGVDDCRICEAIRLVGMEKRANEKVKKYSLGMKQRIGVAQAILHRPRLLILDEPTNGLDPAGIRELRTIVRELAEKEKVAVFVSSHLLSEMELMCDRVAIIDKGSVIGEKTVEELRHLRSGEAFMFRLSAGKDFTAILNENGFKVQYTKETDGYAEIAVETPYEKVPDAVRLLSGSGADIYSVKPVENTLEDAFISITGGGMTIE